MHRFSDTWLNLHNTWLALLKVMVIIGSLLVTEMSKFVFDEILFLC